MKDKTMNEPKLDWDRPMEIKHTKHKVEFLRKIQDPNAPMLCLITGVSGLQWPGQFSEDSPNLQNTPEKFELKRWVNVYRKDTGELEMGHDYRTKQEAENSRATEKNAITVACLEVTISGVVGQGL